MSDSREKEKQLIIRSLHSAYFTKNVLAKNLGALIHNQILQEIGKVAIRYYGTNDQPLTLDTLNLKLGQSIVTGKQIGRAHV